eukprot:s3284_g6.t1
MAEPSAGSLPKPGSFITPQAGDGLQKEVEKFFDQATFRGEDNRAATYGSPTAYDRSYTRKHQKGDLSTRSGSASIAPTSTPGELDGDELGDDELARLELEVDAELDGMMTQPEHVVPFTPPSLPPQPPVTTPPSLPPPPPVKTEPEVTGNLAKGLDDGILPGDLYDAKVEEMITARFEKLDDHQFQKLLEAAPVHPDYDTYCHGIRVENGLDTEDWVFGREEPLLDMVGLHCWAFSRQQLRDRLALGDLTAGKGKGNDGRGVGSVGGGGGGSKPPPLVHPSQLETPPQPPPKAAAPTPVEKAASPAVEKTASPAASTAIAKGASPAVGEVPSPAVEKAASPAASTDLAKVPSPAVEKAASPANTPVGKAAAETTAASEPVTPAKAPGTAATLGGGLPVKAPALPSPSTLPLEWMKSQSKCEVEVKRRNLQSTSAKSKDVAMSVAQLEATGKYSKEDIQELVKRKKAQGAYIQDPNFPGREDLYQYLINQETSAEVAHTREDSQEVSSSAVVDGQEALALTEDGCDFAANTAPTIRSLMTDLGGAAGEAPTGPTPKAKAGTRKGKGKGKGQNKGKEGETENQKPDPDKLPTPLAKATTLKGKVLPVFNLSSDQNRGGLMLKEAEEARSLCVAIETLECSGELVSALTQHSSLMTDLYRQLNKLTTENVDDITVYQPLFDKAMQYSAWYAKRKNVANSMKQEHPSS